MRKLTGVTLAGVLLVLLAGCGIPVAAPTGGGQGHLCRFVRESVLEGVMTYDYAAYFYPRCQPLPVPEAN